MEKQTVTRGGFSLVGIEETNCSRGNHLVSDDLKSLSMKMKFKKVVRLSVHQNCSNAAHRFPLASIFY